ncbi:cytoplasmic protein [mine drainage metagenome]|uniref:Cytoplasmic protein n=1 Tax=mine drainage metagenome TaxID=410659 RepID=T1BX18_9ZZZZ
MTAQRRGSVRLRKLIEEATVDANDEYEQEAGFLNEFEERLRCPFRGLVVGEWVDVQKFDVGEGGRGLLAVCRRHGREYRVHITELEWMGQPPEGAEWIEAYRLWLKGGG